MSNEVAVKKSGKKKMVQLSGIPVGQTEICTVGKLGHDLRYRGYDINDLAEFGTFEEVAYLLIYGELPIYNELQRYKLTLKKPARFTGTGQSCSRANPGSCPSDGRPAHRCFHAGRSFA